MTRLYKPSRWLAVALTAALGPAFVQAGTFGAGIENSRWNLSASVFECSLNHEIPHLGRAVFYQRAGEPLEFHLDVHVNPMAPGQAALVLEAPPWRPGAAVADLGYVKVAQSQRPITLPTRTAWRMMASLSEGMAPTFTRKSAYGPDRVRVRLSHVNFIPMSDDFQRCVASLLPVNYDQVERTSIYFAMGSKLLSRADREALDQVALYLSADGTISSVYIDGHADQVGNRIDNRGLSEERAHVVRDYLLSRGVNPAKLVTRYHGDRYPAPGPGNDRRTTIRLERAGESSSDEIMRAGAGYFGETESG